MVSNGPIGNGFLVLVIATVEVFLELVYGLLLTTGTSFVQPTKQLVSIIATRNKGTK